MAAPRVSVLMTTWNGAGFIGASLGSVLRQSFSDFEVIVVDDGSTDGTARVVAAIGDPRLRLLRLPANGGIVAARNAGFAVATGTYIAALDHDDLADPDRFARQVAFLDAHPEIVLAGTEIRIDDHGTLRRPDHPRQGDALALRWQLLIDNPLTWSSVMFRADSVRRLGGFMRGAYEPADDFDFYHRLLAVGGIVRLDEVLTTYRYHGGNASHAAAERLNHNAARVLEAAYMPWFGAGAMAAAELVVRHLSDRQPVRDRATLVRIGEIVETLFAGFCAVHHPSAEDRDRLAASVGRLWWRVVRAAVRSGGPGLVRVHRRMAMLAGFHRPGVADVMMSVGVGVIRGVVRR